MRATINVPNSKNCSQVINIGITSPRGKAKKKLTLPVIEKQPPPLWYSSGSPPFGRFRFLFYGECRDLSRKSGRSAKKCGRPVVAPTKAEFLGEAERSRFAVRATGGRPYKSGVFRETGWCRFCRVGVVGCPYKQGKQGLHGRYRIAPLFYTAERYPRASYGKLLSLV